MIVLGAIGRRIVDLLNHLLRKTLKRDFVKAAKQFPVRLLDFAWHTCLLLLLQLQIQQVLYGLDASLYTAAPATAASTDVTS